MLQQSLTQRQKIRQEQTLAPIQYQSLEILTANLAEIQQKINQEMMENPTLECVNGGLDQLSGNPLEDSQLAEASEMAVRDDDGSAETQMQNQLLEKIARLRENDHSPPQSSSTYDNRDDESSEKRYQYFWNSLVSERSFEDYLYEQLNQSENLHDKQRKICLEIIGSIDHAGYLRSHPADIATACQTSIKEAEQALRIVQSFDPPGIGARDLRECLLLQLERQGKKHTLAWRVVDKHLPDIEKNKVQKICRKLRISMYYLHKAIKEIRLLNPYPASHLSSISPTEFVVPEVVVELDQFGEPQIQAHHEYIPKLRISDYYLKLLQAPETTEETKAYVREKLNNSRQLLNMLKQRESTIIRITRRLIEDQYKFFTRGIHHLAPLTMSQLAKELEMHETTVSRAIANKYIMTPHGLFSLRYFFTSGYHQNNGGEKISSQVIKEKIKEMILAEDQTSPLTDKELASAIQKKGYNLARRTIAKYREELAIPSSSKRKRYF